MKGLRVSFFVHDLAANPVVRAVPLALALQPTHEVEILGLLTSGPEVYGPYRDLFPYKTLRCSLNLPSVLAAIPRLAAMATGDVVYACKPLVTSLGPALLARRRARQRRLLLDVEDDEWLPMGSTWSQFLWRDIIKGWRNATAWKYTRLVHPLTLCADGVSVSSRRLQRRYGGTLIRHGPDEAVFNPERPELRDTALCRREFGLPSQRHLALFAGVPQPHKGLAVLVQALLRAESSEWDLVLAGSTEHPDFQSAAQLLGPRCHLLGPIPHPRLPWLLGAVDVVPVPQRRGPFAESQIPAKVLEALAMAKPVVASCVGDLPEILGNGARGWLVEPDDVHGLAVALAEVAREPTVAARRGAEARRWFLEEASAACIRRRLESLIASA
jgi:glycosyltransferase involved in cell wall biosynthesis